MLCASQNGERSEQGFGKGAIPSWEWAHSRMFSTSGLQLAWVWPLETVPLRHVTSGASVSDGEEEGSRWRKRGDHETGLSMGERG